MNRKQQHNVFRRSLLQQRNKVLARRGRCPGFESLEDRRLLAVTIVDLTSAGAEGSFAGAYPAVVYKQVDPQSTGTGTFGAFSQMKPPNNDTTARAYNTTEHPVLDNNSSHIHNHSVTLGDVPIVIKDGKFYRQFILDIAESQGQGDEFLSLDEVQIFVGGTANSNVATFDADGVLEHDGDLVYRLDPDPTSGNDNWVAMNSDLNPGNGGGDLGLLIPIGYFNGFSNSDVVTLYSSVGFQGINPGPNPPAGNYGASASFEEWGLGADTPDISGMKWHDLNANGVKDLDEPGLEGWTIYIDGNNNNNLDDGEPTTITDANGDYTFPSFAPGTYTVREVLTPGWIQSYPSPLTADGEHSVTTDDDPITDIDFGNYLLGSIHAFKFLDVNQDGVWDSDGVDPTNTADDETPLEGIAFQLLNADGDPVGAVKFSDANGEFWFTGLTPDIYTIKESVDPQYKATTPSSVQVTVQSGEELVWRPGAAMLDADALQHEVLIDPDNSGYNEGLMFGNAEDTGGGGHTPGFWKSNAANATRRPEKFGHNGSPDDPLAWHDTGVTPDTKLSAKGFIGFPDKTFEEALNSNGGGINTLLRHASAAYLNAAHDEAMVDNGEEPCIGYPLSTAEILALVNAALANGGAAINSAHTLLAGYNELGPVLGLDQFGRCGDEVAALRTEKAAPASALGDAASVQLAQAPESDVSLSGESSIAAAMDDAFDSVASDYLQLAVAVGSNGVEEASLDALAGENAESESLASVSDDALDLLLVVAVGSNGEEEASLDAVVGETAESEPTASVLDDAFDLLSVELRLPPVNS